MKLSNNLPEIEKASFICPYTDCRTLANQTWHNTFVQKLDYVPAVITSAQTLEAYISNLLSSTNLEPSKEKEFREKLEKMFNPFRIKRGNEERINAHATVYLKLTECFSCRRFAVWVGDKLVFPETTSRVINLENCPSTVIELVEEALSVEMNSPRAACTLLRVALERLLIEVDIGSGNLYKRLAALNLNETETLFKLCEFVRVSGNESAHAGELDLKNNRETVDTLFKCIERINERFISDLALANQVYDKIPDSKKRKT